MYFHCLNGFYHYASLSLNNHGKNLGKVSFFDVGIDMLFPARLIRYRLVGVQKRSRKKDR